MVRGLFRELARAVVVRADRDHDRQAPGAMPGADEMVARRLARRVRAARVAGAALRARGLARVKRAVDLVGRDVIEAERRALGRGARGPVRARGFEHGERPFDIAANERRRSGDAAVDVRLGGEVEHGARPMQCEEPVEQRPVADVAVHQDVAGVALERGKVLALAGVVRASTLKTTSPVPAISR